LAGNGEKEVFKAKNKGLPKGGWSQQTGSLAATGGNGKRLVWGKKRSAKPSIKKKCAKKQPTAEEKWFFQLKVAEPGLKKNTPRSSGKRQGPNSLGEVPQSGRQPNLWDKKVFPWLKTPPKFELRHWGKEGGKGGKRSRALVPKKVLTSLFKSKRKKKRHPFKKSFSADWDSHREGQFSTSGLGLNTCFGFRKESKGGFQKILVRGTKEGRSDPRHVSGNPQGEKPRKLKEGPSREKFLLLHCGPFFEEVWTF